MASMLKNKHLIKSTNIQERKAGLSRLEKVKKFFFSRGPIEGTVEIHFLSGGVVSVVPLKAVDYL